MPKPFYEIILAELEEMLTALKTISRYGLCTEQTLIIQVQVRACCNILLKARGIKKDAIPGIKERLFKTRELSCDDETRRYLFDTTTSFAARLLKRRVKKKEK